MTRKRWLPGALLISLVVGCGGDPSDDSSEGAAPTGSPPVGQRAPAPTAAPGTIVTVDLADRPFRLQVPASYDPAGAVPLVVLLHGYTSDSTEQESYFRLGAESVRRGFLYALPEGTTNHNGQQFWNATAACCDFGRTGVDDSGYLRRLVDEVSATYAVDRVYIVGHSNGGFMAYRLACNHAEVITAIVSLAGAATDDPSECTPSGPVSVLQIHGTDDGVIPYGGGANAGNRFPSVAGTLELWRDRNGCSDQVDPPGPRWDLDADRPGAETTVTTHATGCQDGTRVELWTIEGGSHVPALTADFAPAVVDFLYAQGQ